MPDLLSQIDQWRAKAEELFTKADAMRNDVARDQMMQTAENYISLADHMEDLAAKQRAAQQRRR